MALTKLNWINSDVNCVQPEKMRRLTEKMAASTALNGRKAVLAALNRKIGRLNSVDSEKTRR